MSFYYILWLINTFFKVRLYQAGGDAWFGVRLDLISFIYYSVKYHPNTPLVLKHLNIEIKLMEEIGVVGRSGKSTLCLCLFRMLEATEGIITIDDVDISTISLEELGDNITLIPQEPTLIEGSLRENIDY